MIKRTHIFILLLKIGENNSYSLKIIFHFTLFLKIISREQLSNNVRKKFVCRKKN